jgi:flagellar biosynthesis regulator FlaF
MSSPNQAMKAYAASAATRPLREQEADVFRRVNAVLRRGKEDGGLAKLRALADNERLWSTVIMLLRDPENALPAPMRASIVSVGLAVQREMRKPEPDFGFLIEVNDNIAAGLAATPGAGAP